MCLRAKTQNLAFMHNLHTFEEITADHKILTNYETNIRSNFINKLMFLTTDLNNHAVIKSILKNEDSWIQKYKLQAILD